jgi:hypothetical protein
MAASPPGFSSSCQSAKSWTISTKEGIKRAARPGATEVE